jgi:hypothetical protein
LQSKQVDESAISFEHISSWWWLIIFPVAGIVVFAVKLVRKIKSDSCADVENNDVSYDTSSNVPNNNNDNINSEYEIVHRN